MPPVVFHLDPEVKAACKAGDLERVQSLWADGAHGKRAFGTDGGGEGPIHVAAAAGRTDVVAWLVSVADEEYLDKIDGDGRSALLWASWHGHTETVMRLCELGAIVNLKARTSSG